MLDANIPRFDGKGYCIKYILDSQISFLMLLYNIVSLGFGCPLVIGYYMYSNYNQVQVSISVIRVSGFYSVLFDNFVK